MASSFTSTIRILGDLWSLGLLAACGGGVGGGDGRITGTPIERIECGHQIHVLPLRSGPVPSRSRVVPALRSAIDWMNRSAVETDVLGAR